MEQGTRQERADPDAYAARVFRRRADRDARSTNSARHFAVAGAIVLLGAFTHPSSAPRSDPGVYSYSTDDHVVVMRGEDEVTRWTAAEGEVTGRMVWTDDGNHVAFFAEAEGDAARRLVTLDARSGAERALPCDTCARIAAAGNDVLMVGTHDGDGFSGLLRLDLSRATPPADVPAELPPLVDAAIFSGTHGEVLLQGVDRTGGEVYLRVRPDGTTSPVGTATTPAATGRGGRSCVNSWTPPWPRTRTATPCTPSSAASKRPRARASTPPRCSWRCRHARAPCRPTSASPRPSPTSTQPPAPPSCQCGGTTTTACARRCWRACATGRGPSGPPAANGCSTTTSGRRSRPTSPSARGPCATGRRSSPVHR